MSIWISAQQVIDVLSECRPIVEILDLQDLSGGLNNERSPLVELNCLWVDESGLQRTIAIESGIWEIIWKDGQVATYKRPRGARFACVKS